MAIAKSAGASLRPERGEYSRLLRAFVLSLVLHAACFGTYRAGKQLGWWQNLHWPRWFQSVKLLSELLKKKDAHPPVPLPQQEPALRFVDISPEQATPDPPKNAKFESDKNSKAANIQADQDTGVPKIEGKHPDLVKTEDVPRKQFTPLQPAAPPPQPATKEEQPEMKPKPKEAPGDMAMAKPDPTPQKDPGDAAQSRPRTIKEALARQQNNNRLPGQKMKQEGGVKRFLELSSVDAKATPFGAYDAALVEAISQRWFALLDQRQYASDGQGKVVVQFVLHHDGRVAEVNIAENSAGEVLGLICQKAIQDPSPFGAWSPEMRLKFGDTRNVQFTFYYN
jgi:outer membrane biosynthesis protein TonB